MPARRKTAQELILSGAATAKPARYAHRLKTPEVKPLGRAPDCLTDEQKAIWRQIVRLTPVGLLAASDTFCLELATRLLHRVRITPVIKPSELAVLISLLSKLGLTPADRSRLDLPSPTQKTDERDPWGRF